MTICPNYATKKWHRGRARCLQAKPNLTCTSYLQVDCQMQGKGPLELILTGKAVTAV